MNLYLCDGIHLSSIRIMFNTAFLLSLLTAVSITCSAKVDNPIKYKISFQEKQNIPWVDSVMAKLTLEEKIAQLFMVAGYSSKSQDNTAQLLQLVNKYHIGGVIFFQGGPKSQVQLTNRLQKSSNVPLLIGMDAEWGPSMRLDSIIRFPRQMMLGALQNDSLVFEMGGEIARQLKRLGVHINFAPVADVNNNPNNPVINTRSFGENRQNTSNKAIAYMLGLQENGILACAKHFPGHGDTDKDSHETLPSVLFEKDRLDSLELYPFRKLFDAGISSVMVGHLMVPSLTHSSTLPTSLSDEVVIDLLQKTLGFKGLIFTDAMNMKGVSNYRKPSRVNALALMAGNDILVYPNEIGESIQKIARYVHRGRIPHEEIEAKCRKVLTAKYFAGLSKYTPIDTTNIINDLNDTKYLVLKRRLCREAITVVRNDYDLIPFQQLDTLSIAYVELDSGMGTPFLGMLNNYASIHHYSLPREATNNQIDSLKRLLQPHNLIVFGYHNLDARPQFNFGIRHEMTDFISETSTQKKVVLCLFGSPYALEKFPLVDLPASIVVGYDNSTEVQEMTAQILFGAIGAKGMLPVSAGINFPGGNGLTTEGGLRLSYVMPEEIGISKVAMAKIDSIANFAILQGATPGCQVYAAVDGKIFLNKGYGKQTYNSNDQNVSSGTVYDVASVTKVVATLPIVMQLFESKKLSITDSLGKFISFPRNNSKKNIYTWQLLTHQGGLKEFLPFHLDYLTAIWPKDKLYSTVPSDSFPLRISSGNYINLYYQLNPTIFSHHNGRDYPNQIAQNIYAIKSLKDSIYKKIDRTLQYKDIQYRYSDHGFIYLQRIIESITKTPLDSLTQTRFYCPLGMRTTMYKPTESISPDSIAPTEYDFLFRKQVVRGFVHDQTAALLGGVAGNAGIFSNANDLGKLLQVFLQNGSYGGKTYFKPETVKFFTSAFSISNRRGLGWDKPETIPGKPSPVGLTVSPSSYGHSGFTGTLVWVDPETKLVFVFLSNRVFPNAENTKLAKMNIRTDMLDVLEEAVKGRK
ncbi:beta-glucosidase [Williamwhitmania taraxaci]|uniref:beta-N-acetylhexosaminidase n=2 Tax=Williamwhitmania taraxaci TaxID=1640674 RepID=A0A1G6GM77_9BACT|nr:beta-glucosidase [Williamwhitmania taraxaci]